MGAFQEMRSDRDLVHAVISGDREAYADLIQRYQRVVRAVGVQILGDLHAAEDAAQESFLKAYVELRTLRDGSSFGPWLMKIARRRALTRLRSRREETRIDKPSELADSRHDGRLDEQSTEVLAAVATLPEHERRAVMLRHFEGHSVKAIAEITGRSVGTVTKQLSRAYHRLRRHLGESR